MKTKTRFLLFLTACTILCGFTACNDHDEHEPGKPDCKLPLPSIGTYSFDAQQGSIADGVFMQDEQEIQFIFSPQMMTDAVDTYFLVGVRNYWIGQTIDCQSVYHNDDYVFVYEDPRYLYTQYKKVSGTILIDRKGDRFTVSLDLRLHDGKPFTASFEGELRNGNETEE